MTSEGEQEADLTLEEEQETDLTSEEDQEADYDSSRGGRRRYAYGTSTTRGRGLSSLHSEDRDSGSRDRGSCSRPRGRGSRSRGRGSSSRGRGSRSRSRGSRGGSRSSRSRSRGSRGRNRGRGSRRATNLWTWNTSKDDSNVLHDFTFTGNLPGPFNGAEHACTVLECFSLFISEGFYVDLADQSNTYAQQEQLRRNLAPCSDEFTKDDMMAFIGIVIAMGVVCLPAIHDYWSIDPILSHPWFRAIMSHRRFEEVLRFFHVVDNTTQPDRSSPGYDKLWKIRPLITLLSENCLKYYCTHPQISIDESMIGTKCRLSFLQYIPKKPVKWGIKVWMCADAVTGYAHTFEVYTGADEVHSKHPKGVTYSVVMHLLEHLFDKGYTVYMDNFYSSPVLFLDLVDKNIAASGTAKTNRTNFPEYLKPDSKVPRGTCTFMYYKSLTATHWYDNRDVYALSTAVDDTVVQVRRRVENEVIDVTCPEIIQDYNSFMGGVDICDQYMCYYSLGRKSMKWWRRIFWRLHDIAITNAYVIYKYNHRNSLKKMLTHQQFRLELAKQMAHPYVLSRKNPGRRPKKNLDRLKGKHFLYHSQIRARCAVCSYKKTTSRGKKYKDKKIKTRCFKCEVNLCVGKCNELYHTKVEYKSSQY